MTDPENESSDLHTAAPKPTVASPRRIIGNALWNWLGIGAETFVAVLLTPFLIHRLGNSAYGTWIIIGSLTSYLGVLDFGLRTSVGRHVALCVSRRDRDGVLDVVNSALFVLAFIGSASLLITTLIALFFEHLTDVPAALLADARRAMLIVGVQLALFFVLRIFDAVLWGYQQFKVLNIVDGLSAVLRGCATAAVVAGGYGLVGLACVTLTLTVGVGAIKAILSRKTDPDLHLARRHVRLATLRALWGYGIWNFVAGLASLARLQLSPVAIGSILGLAMVTPFSIIMRLLNVAGMIVRTGTDVLTPVATALHGLNDLARQRRMLAEAGKICLAFALYFFALFFFLGKPLLTLWIGPDLAWAWTPLVIMACGELFPMSVAMSENTILGMAQNRPLAFRGAAECVTALGLAFPLGHYYGLNGFCVSLAIAAAFWRGAFLLVQATRLVELPLLSYARECVAPMLVTAAVPVALLAVAAQAWEPTTWPSLCLYTAAFSVLFGAVTAVRILGWGFLAARCREIGIKARSQNMGQ